MPYPQSFLQEFIMRKFVKGSIIKYFVYFAIFFVFLMPLLKLFFMSFNGMNGIGIENYSLLFRDNRTHEAIYNTILIAIFSTLLSLFLGGIFAFFIAYTNIRKKCLIELMVLAPFIIPSYIIALAWSSFLDNGGIIQQSLDDLHIPALNLYSIGGIVFVMGLCHMPIVYLSVLSTLRKIPKDLEWAARMSGYTMWQTFIKINLPLAMPAFMSGGVLSFLAAIDNFAIPAFLGISANIPVLSTSIYEKVISFGPSSFHMAAALSIILSIVAIGANVVHTFFVKRSSNKESMQEDFSVRIFLSTSLRRKIQWGCIAFLGIIDIVPLINMLFTAFQKSYGMQPAIENLSLYNFIFLIKNHGVHQALYNSVVLSILTCIICIIVGTACAYAKVRYQSRAAMVLESAASLTYAIPGVVIALAMIFHWGKIPYVYGSIGILILAYCTRYLILQIKNSTTALLTIHPSLEEAGKIFGANQLRIWKTIVSPLLLRPILAGSFLIFISALTELSLSSMLASAGTKTIGLFIFNLQQGGDYNLASAMSVFIILIVLMAYYVVEYFNRQKTS